MYFMSRISRKMTTKMNKIYDDEIRSIFDACANVQNTWIKSQV